MRVLSRVVMLVEISVMISELVVVWSMLWLLNSLWY